MKGSDTAIVAYFSLGSNLGDRKGNLESAIQLLGERSGTIDALSGVYESPSWGYTSAHSYYNSCLGLRTSIEPVDLVEIALQVERDLGRVRPAGGYDDRIIDIDLLLYGDLVMDHPRLVLPHPRMSDRGFVLVPLAEIVPDMVHPVSGITISSLLDRCSDRSVVIPV